VRDFVACLVWANYKMSTIMVTLASLRRWAVDMGDVSGRDALDHPEVNRALKAASKLAVQEVRQKLPLAFEDLQSVLRVLQADPVGGEYVAARDAAMFVIGWAGMLRSSELVALQWRDVHFTSVGDVMLYLPRSKTDPGAGAWVLLASGYGSAVSPARVLRSLQLLVGGAAAHGHVFKASPASVAPLQKGTVACRLKKALAMAGVPGADRFAAHSLRRGGATHAAKVGVPVPRFVQLMGRWRSDVVRLYMYASPSQASVAAVGVDV
jgi:integrase